MQWLWWIVGGVALFAALGSLLIVAARRWERQQVRRAIQSFRHRREQLEARFYDLAKAQGKPRGLRWIACDWLDATTFARDRATGLITAFAGVNVRFEAIEGGEMEEVAAVGTVRDAVALFHFQSGGWGTGGRALFNMNPEDAVTRLADQYEPLPAELTTSSPRRAF